MAIHDQHKQNKMSYKVDRHVQEKGIKQKNCVNHDNI